MTENESVELLSILTRVEKDEYGRPLVLSRYGFRVMEFEGKSYVVAMTPKELAAKLAVAQNRPAEEIEVEIQASAAPYCATEGAMYNCYPRGGCSSGCDKVYLGGGHWNCVCRG